MESYAIVGFGCAGYNGAKALREHGFDGEIHVYSDVGAGPENPMMMTYYAGGIVARDACTPFGSLENIADDLGLTPHVAAVARINGKNREIMTDTGIFGRFDKILIASGASPHIPPIKGISADGVHVVRTMRDAERIKERLESGVSSAVVVGASMIGIKVAELLRTAGAECLLVDIEPRLFPLAALEDTAAELQRRLEEKGVKQVYGVGVGKILRDGGKMYALLTTGERIQADIFAICTGTKCNTEFIVPGTIRTDKGIVVNERMETSAEGIYAAGDCCQGYDIQSGRSAVFGLWESAGMQGRTAGKNMAGACGEYDGNIPHNITHFMDMDFAGIGDNSIPGERRTYKLNNGLMIELVADDSHASCINLLGDHKVCGIIKSMFLKRLRSGIFQLAAEQESMLRMHGVPSEVIGFLGGTDCE